MGKGKIIFVKYMFIIGVLNLFTFSVQAQSTAQSNEKASTVPTDTAKVKKYTLFLYPSFGAGLYRNDLAPTFLINIGLRKRNIYEINVNTNSIFFFERDDNRNYQMYRNTFLNGEFLLNLSFFNSGEVKNWNGIGLGYLVESKGQYFKEATIIVYYRKKLRHISFMPGIIFSDNLKDAFPVITIRL